VIGIGIFLFVAGALIAILASGEIERLGYVVAVIGVVVIVLALLLGLGGESRLDAALLAPVLATHKRASG
jgi:hypothetical protein